MAEITLEQRRHSAAHLMARAVMNLFEDVQVDIGPATDEGFYYDFDLPHRLSPEDFPKIESEIARMIALDEPFVRKEVSADEAKKLLAGQKYKLERLADVVADGVAISTYAVGDYVEKDGKYYKCKTAIESAGAWDATKWDEQTASWGATAQSYKSGIFIDPTMWGFATLSPMEHFSIVDEGGGPGGWHETTLRLTCLNPMGQFRVRHTA